MTSLWIILIVVALSIAAMMVHFRRMPPVPTNPVRKAARSVAASRAAKSPLAPSGAAALPALVWDAPVLDITRKYGEGGPRTGAAVAVAPDVTNAQRAKMRGRYLAARFPGVTRTAADLLESGRIIHSARLYFEERKSDRAIELLGLAVAQCPADESLPLAQLEIAFLARDPAVYVALAASFHQAHPASAHWSEVGRLGRAIAPGEALFGADDGPRDKDHYGPWPDMPNWIQAPWDLTGEVRATEFHQAMARRAA